MCSASELVAIATNGELVPIEAEAQPDERQFKSVGGQYPKELRSKRRGSWSIYEAMLEAYPFRPVIGSICVSGPWAA